MSNEANSTSSQVFGVYPKAVVFGLALVGFAAAQRFTLPTFSPYVCAIPLAVAVLHFSKKDTATRNACLVLALLFVADIPVTENAATPSWLRYAVSIVGLAALFDRTRINGLALGAMLMLGTAYIFVALLHLENVNFTQLQRDLLILTLATNLVAFTFRGHFNFDYSILFYGTLGFVIGEWVNFFALSEYWYGNYMSYATTKYLVLLPSILMLVNGRYLFALVLVFFTLPVLIGYSTRMILVLYLLCLCILFFRAPLLRPLTKVVIPIFAFALLVLVDAFNTLEAPTTMGSFKATAMFLTIAETGLAAVEMLDPVRYHSNLLFFSLPLNEVLFGRGFGAGIADTGGSLGFVRYDATAFSDVEISSGNFYNFHDVWIDVGIRFGLVPFSVFLWWVFFQKRVAWGAGQALWVIGFTGVFCGFYSSAGLVSLFLILRGLIFFSSRTR